MKTAKKSKYAELAQQVRELPLEKACASYKWEELVQKLCASDDVGLHDIGVRELKLLQQKCPNCPVFKKSW